MHVTVENTGTYPVQEAVQVYVRFSEREAYDPGYQLKGIRSVALECGEKNAFIPEKTVFYHPFSA